MYPKLSRLKIVVFKKYYVIVSHTVHNQKIFYTLALFLLSLFSEVRLKSPLIEGEERDGGGGGGDPVEIEMCLSFV